MGNRESRNKPAQNIYALNFKDIIDYDFQQLTICKIDTHYIRVHKYTLTQSTHEQNIFITCDFSFFLYIKDQLQMFNYDKQKIQFVICFPCHITFDIFSIENKVCMELHHNSIYTYKLIRLLLQNLPSNINNLIMDHDIYWLCSAYMNNLPCGLQLIQIKKNIFDKVSIRQTNIPKLPHGCIVEFI
jgi:hypothetical protein